MNEGLFSTTILLRGLGIQRRGRISCTSGGLNWTARLLKVGTSKSVCDELQSNTNLDDSDAVPPS